MFFGALVMFIIIMAAVIFQPSSVRPTVEPTPQTHESSKVEDVSADYEEAINKLSELGLTYGGHQ